VRLLGVAATHLRMSLLMRAARRLLQPQQTGSCSCSASDRYPMVAAATLNDRCFLGRSSVSSRFGGADADAGRHDWPDHLLCSATAEAPQLAPPGRNGRRHVDHHQRCDAPIELPANAMVLSVTRPRRGVVRVAEDQPPVDGLAASWSCQLRAHWVEQNGSPLFTPNSGRLLRQFTQSPSRRWDGSARSGGCCSPNLIRVSSASFPKRFLVAASGGWFHQLPSFGRISTSVTLTVGTMAATSGRRS